MYIYMAKINYEIDISFCAMYFLSLPQTPPNMQSLVVINPVPIFNPLGLK